MRLGSHPQLLLHLLDGGAWLCKYKVSFSFRLYTLDPLKRILNCVTWVGNMCGSCCIEIIGPEGVWYQFDAMVRWHRNAQLMSSLKATWPKEAWICNYGWSFFFVWTSADLPAACQLSIKKDCTKCRLQVIHWGRGGVCWSHKSALLSCPGYFCTTVSLLSHLNCTNKLCCCRYY